MSLFSHNLLLIVFVACSFIFADALKSTEQSIHPSIQSNQVITIIEQDDAVWKITSTHYPVQVDDEVLLEVRFGQNDTGDYSWDTYCYGIDNEFTNIRKSWHIPKATIADAGIYTVMPVSPPNRISQIPLSISAAAPGEIVEACDITNIVLWMRNASTWDIDSNFTFEDDDALKLYPEKNCMEKAFFCTLPTAGTISFAAGIQTDGFEPIDFWFIVLNDHQDTIVKQEIGSLEPDTFKQYTFAVPAGTHMAEWVMQTSTNTYTKYLFNSAYLDKISFIPDSPTPVALETKRVPTAQHSPESTHYDILGRKIVHSALNKDAPRKASQICISHNKIKFLH